MRHGYSIQEGDKEKLLPSNSTRTVPAGECTHSQSGTSFAYFLVVVATNILRYSGIQQGALALTSDARPLDCTVLCTVRLCPTIPIGTSDLSVQTAIAVLIHTR